MDPNIDSNTVVQLKAPTHFLIKLTPTNFSVWSRQVQSTLIGLDLVGYINGTNVIPSKTIDDGAVNPLYTIWYRQDQIIVSALLGSCSDTIQPTISTAASAGDVWTRLSSTYASTMPGRILFLKAQLAKNPKGTRTIAEYLKDMGDIADSVTLVGQPISDSDLVASIITQLGDDYRSVYSALCVRETTVSLADLSDILLDIERLTAIRPTHRRCYPPSIRCSPAPTLSLRAALRHLLSEVVVVVVEIAVEVAAMVEGASPPVLILKILFQGKLPPLCVNIAPTRVTLLVFVASWQPSCASRILLFNLLRRCITHSRVVPLLLNHLGYLTQAPLTTWPTPLLIFIAILIMEDRTKFNLAMVTLFP